MVVTFFQKIFHFLGVDTHKLLFKIFEINAQSVLKKKMSSLSLDCKKLLLEENEKLHYGDSVLDENASQYVVRSFTIDRINFIHSCLNNGEKDTVVDLGDSNGIFIRMLGNTGISVNISDQTVRYLKEKNVEVVRGDIQYLPFKNDCIDAIFLFETLEHVQNPLLLLNEIGRVCHRSLILSIPYVETTHINRYTYTDGRPVYQYHIFEFNPMDFKNILNLTQFSIKDDKIAVVLDERVSLWHRMIFLLWATFIDKDTYCGCFKRFYMCHLVKKTG